MLPNVETWMFYRGEKETAETQLAAVTVSAHRIKVVPISQYIELRDKNGVNFLTLTWPSDVKVRKVGN